MYVHLKALFLGLDAFIERSSTTSWNEKLNLSEDNDIMGIKATRYKKVQILGTYSINVSLRDIT